MINKLILLGFVSLALAGAGCSRKAPASIIQTSNMHADISNVPPAISTTTNTVSKIPTTPSNAADQPPERVTQETLVAPMDNFFDRITRKPFGIYITPSTSPIQPEKFSGYHTGVDAETTADEADIDIPIYSIADGSVVFAGHVNGYGGVIIVESKINGETVNALYGHLRISSFAYTAGNTVKRGKQMAVLGTGFSTETDGERKHLHLGIIKGTIINYRGYVTTKGALSGWEDPKLWLTSGGNQ